MSGIVAIPLFHVRKTVCVGTSSTPNDSIYRGLKALNPNPLTT
jgi:hypothetical protein